MSGMVTVRLDKELSKSVARLSRATGRSRTDLVRDALRRQLAIDELELLRGKIIPLARKQGIFTDEDVSRLIA